MTIDATVGGADANSYVTIAEADAYNAQRGNDDWAALASPAEKEAALISAMDYLDATYGSSWKGTRASTTQALSWPRYGVVIDTVELPSDTIPKTIKNAQIEMALRAAAGDLIPDSGQQVKREKVDVLEVEYASGSVAGTQFTLVSRMLIPYTNGLTGSGNFTQAQLQRV